MAEILPFRALHYNPEVAGDLPRLVTQPYDKITPLMQERYHALSPYNLVRIIRGLERPGAGENVYARAARALREWVEQGVLVSERAPAVYPYNQEYALPGAPGRRLCRRGFIALVRLEDYSARVVHRHEETLTGPKADRLELLRATRAHFGQIFFLYSDPAGEIESLLARATGAKPWEEVTDEYSTRHTVWRAEDAGTIQAVIEAMRARPLVIADGHHRYETALAYRDERRLEASGDARAEFVMGTFIRMETEGLTILPTHRVLHSLPAFDWARFLADARAFFDWEPLDSAPGDAWLARLSEAGRARPSFLAYAGRGQAALLGLRDDPPALLPDLAPGLARLDVVLLHRLLLERVLRIDRQAVRDERHLRYVREAREAREQVEGGEAQLAFLLNPTPVGAVWENALASSVLPQKSTDFYPKLLSGLTAYWLDNPAGI